MPNASCDLHLHSHYSDGKASPAELLHHAADIGLKVVSITDHDNYRGYQEAANVAGTLGLDLLPGIEFTTRWDACPPAPSGESQDVDLLGYCFDPQDPAFQKFALAALDDSRQRILHWCQLLTEAGYPITEADLHRENPRYTGGMQVINGLITHGHAPNWNAAVILANQYWPQVRASGVNIQDAIQAIHQSGGVAVLAHPVQIDWQGERLPDAALAQLVEWGLDGIEVLHPRLSPEDRAHFRRLIQAHGLLVSGGSDEHGWRNQFARMGSELVTYEMVNALRQRARR